MDAPPTVSADAGVAPVSRSPFQMAMRRFVRNRKAVVSAALLGFVAAAALLVPWITPLDYREMDWDYQGKPPNARYWMGTDVQGRDLLVRIFLGGRISLAVGLLATSVSALIGVAYGAGSALAGGKTDLLMMRFVDVLYGLPYMLVVIIVMAFFESRSIVFVFGVLGFFGWLTMARIARGQVLSVREREFVEAARALGVRTPALLWRHVIPNILGPVIVYATLSVPAFILQEAFLSFLGLGVSEPDPSWGKLNKEGADALGARMWWLVAFPGAALALTLYCLNSIGDGLRDAFDVQQRPE